MSYLKNTTIPLLEKVILELFCCLDSASSFCIQIPEIEVKTEIASHLDVLAGLARKCETRLNVLGAEANTSFFRSSARNKIDSLHVSFGSTIDALEFLQNRYELLADCSCHVVPDSVFSILDAPTQELTAHILKRANFLCNRVSGLIEVYKGKSSSNLYFVKEFIWNDLPSAPSRDIRFHRHCPETQLSGETLEFATRFHRTLMSLEVPTIEAVAQNIVDSIGLPLDFVCDMSRQAWDEARHANALIELLKEINVELGEFPISCDLWVLTHQHPVFLRLAIHQRIGETIGMNSAYWWSNHLSDRKLQRYSDIFEIIFHDELTHVKQGNFWLSYLLNNDKQKIDSAVKLAMRIRMEQQDSVIDGQKKYPINREAMRTAGYSDEEIDLHG